MIYTYKERIFGHKNLRTFNLSDGVLRYVKRFLLHNSLLPFSTAIKIVRAGIYYIRPGAITPYNQAPIYCEKDMSMGKVLFGYSFPN